MILRQLLRQPGWVSSQELADRLGLSRRALTYALGEVDELLEAGGLQAVERVPGKGLRLAEAQRSRAFALLDEDVSSDVVIDPADPKGRRLFVLFSILCVDARSTVERMANQMQTSARTVSNDMSSLRRTLTGQGLQLVFDKQHGYQVKGNLFVVRNLLLSSLREACVMDTCREVERVVRGLYGMAETEFDRFGATQVGQLQQTLEDVLPNHFERGVQWTILLQVVLISLERGAGHDYGLNDDDRSYLERSAGFELARFLRARASELLGVELSEDEDYYLGIILQSLPTTSPRYAEQNYPFELEVIAQRFILAVSERYDYDFGADSELFGIVVGHMIPLVYRLRFNAQISNPLLESVMGKYGKLHAAVRESVSELEGFAHAELTDDECSFFTLYLASSIEKLSNARRGATRVVIVCNAGNAVSRLLQYKLINAFSIKVVATVGVADLAAALRGSSPVDLIISVVDVNRSAYGDVPFLRVSPLLTDDDYQRLGSHLVRRVFTSVGDEEPEAPGLLDLLGERCFGVCDEVEGMDELILLGGGLLHKAGLCDEEYPRQMVSAAHCFGPLTTILIAPGIIMPHAGISDHVRGTGFSFVRIRRPIYVNGKEVFCALSLCTRDKLVNQRAIQQVGMLLSRSDFIDRVRAVGTYEEFAETVSQCLKEAEGK